MSPCCSRPWLAALQRWDDGGFAVRGALLCVTAPQPFDHWQGEEETDEEDEDDEENSHLRRQL